MRSLSNQQKQLLFDYCIGLTPQEETAEAEVLISSNEEAAELHAKLKSAFSPLDSLEPEPCPDALAERTVWRLSNLANSSQHRLEQLLSAEKPWKVAIKSRFWGKRIAVAAVFLIVGAVFIISYSGVIPNYARQKSWQQQCQMQLRQIWQAINRYSSDYDGKLPSLTATAGEPWWKVGYQGKENHSNTRPMWRLVKHNYSRPADFVCPGAPQDKTLQFNTLQVQKYNDFPAREYMTYSFQINCSGTASGKLVCRKVLMADLSPLFEELPRDYSKSFRLRLNRDLLTLNSINHRRRGQNVLFGDGRIEFIKTRFTILLEDDIFTLRDTDIYQGCELPSCESDIFLAP